MKKYAIDIDFTMSKRIYMSANSEEEARSFVDSLVKERPYEFANNFNAYVCHEIIDIYED